MEDYTWLYYYYYVLYLFACCSNLLLLYATYKAAAFCAKPCIVILLNMVLADFLLCTVLTSLVPRRIPVGDGIVVFAYGVCGLFSDTLCQILSTAWLVLLAQNIMAITFSFFYRYFVLYHRSIKTKYALLIASIPYMLGLPFLIFARPNTVTGDDLVQITAPYNLTIPSESVNFGYQDYLAVKLVAAHFFAFYMTPIYCIIMFYFRYKVVVYLDRGWALSKQTLEKHRGLVNILTVQSCVPIIHLINIVIYFLEQKQILRISDFDLTFLMCLHLMAASGGMVSLYILRPYRQQAILLFRKITGGSSSKIEQLSNSLPPIKNPPDVDLRIGI